MTLAAGATALAIIAFATAFHLHWAFGGQRGFGVSLPQHPDGAPVLHHKLHLWRPAAFGVTLCLLLLAAMVAARLFVPESVFDQRSVRIFLAVTAVAFIARAFVPNRYVGFFKRLRTTRWARYDTRLYSPLFLILGIALLVLALA